MKYHVYSARIPPKLFKLFQQFAENKHRSVNSELIMAIEQHIGFRQPEEPISKKEKDHESR